MISLRATTIIAISIINVIFFFNMQRLAIHDSHIVISKFQMNPLKIPTPHESLPFQSVSSVGHPQLSLPVRQTSRPWKQRTCQYCLKYARLNTCIMISFHLQQQMHINTHILKCHICSTVKSKFQTEALQHTMEMCY